MNQIDIANLPNQCRTAFDEIEAGKKQSPNEVQIEIGENHKLHRLITAYDYKNGVIASTIFEKKDLSVFAEGDGLPEIALDRLLNERDYYIGYVSFEAKTILDFEKFKLFVIHDPFPDPNGAQHPNHVRIICTKNTKNTQPMVLGAVFYPKLTAADSATE
jgi:hypothetical protein